MRLVFVTQSVDEADPILGATVAKLRALARRCDALVVICDRIGEHDLPENVELRTFGAPSRVERGLRYVRALVPLLLRPRGRRPDAVIAHMCPIYLVLAAPFAKPLRVPLVIWYTHWTIDRTLRAATALCDLALSVDRRSYPLESSKVLGIGHGIDVDQFAARAAPPPPSPRLRLLAIGRTSPSKGFPTLVSAVAACAAAGVELEVELRGPSTTEEEKRHLEELRELVRAERVEEVVSIAGPVPRPQVPELIRAADAVVNTTVGQTAGGALDKVVYESAACGVPIFACNPHFDQFLADLPVELRFDSENAPDLARVLRAFAVADEATRAEAGAELRRRVESGHSVDSWADAVVGVVGGFRR
ncbi:MAG TPA: glycosyltransferase family 4 protein [Gaiellaceae bacterium]|nr:glycosyltransferase family 4 protein [Gaiellaceae bacterium]